MLTKPTFKALVRRSCRIAKTNDYGIYQAMITVRGKVLNPSTGRMVYIDGRTTLMEPPSLLTLPTLPPTPSKSSPELLYFEEMKKRLMEEDKKPVRRSRRLQERKDRAEMNVTVRIIRPKKREKMHLGDTIRMLPDTWVGTKLLPTVKIVGTKLLPTIKLDRSFNL